MPAQPARINRYATTTKAAIAAAAMKSPLKPSPSLLQSPLKQANSLGSGSFLDEEELNAMFGHDPFKKNTTSDSIWVLEPYNKNNSRDSFVGQLDEWDNFSSSFDPINTSSSSSISTSSSADDADTDEERHDNRSSRYCTTSKARVQWRQDENGDVTCEEFEPTITDHNVIRAQWYDAPSFRKFRASCHEVSLKASLDPDYSETFRRHLAACRRGAVPAWDTDDNDDAVEFGSYRGLERAIFRQELQAAKYSAIHSTVAQQNNPFGNSVEALGETSRQWTATARHMAHHLGLQDEIIARQAYQDSNDASSVTRFIEI